MAMAARSVSPHGERQLSPVRASYHELSSPDPLAESSSYDMSQTTPSRVKNVSDQKAKRQEKRASRSAYSSTEITENDVGPWNIRVTVEATPQKDHSASMKKPRIVTHTISVPLMDEMAAEKPKSPPKRASRSRKNSSSGTTGATQSSRSRRQSVTNLDIIPLGDDGDSDEWTAKPRRTKSRTGRVRKSQAGNTPSSQQNKTNFSIAQDGSSQFDILDGAGSLAELQSLDLNVANSRTKPQGASPKDCLSTTSNKGNLRKSSVNSVTSYPTPSPTASDHELSGSPRPARFDQHEDIDVGMDTVMESEGFTMIDLNSLPSVRNMRQIVDHSDITQTLRDSTRSPDLAFTACPVDNTEGPSIQITDDTEASTGLASSPPNAQGGSKKTYCIGHLQLPSSTKLQRHRLVTPMPRDFDPCSSSVLPTPPPAPQSICPERSPVHSSSVLEAGTALREAVVPPSHQQESELEIEVNSTANDLFTGFSDSARRELRAELRFGEELANRQNQNAQQVSGRFSTLSPSQSTATPQQSSATCTVEAMNHSVTSHLTAEAPRSSWEQRLEAKRMENIRQADTHGAIVIPDDDNDDDDGSDIDQSCYPQSEVEETIGDIWLAEARAGSSSPKEHSLNVDHQISTDITEKPRRSLLPSPWKRGQQIDTSSLSSPDETISGLFWAKSGARNASARFGDAVVARPQRLNLARLGCPTDVERSDANLSNAPDPTIELSSDIVPGTRPKDQVSEGQNSTRATIVAFEEPQHIAGSPHSASSLSPHGVHDTRLYETNLDATQISASTPEPIVKQHNHVNETRSTSRSHDSTYSSLSEATEEPYRQRVSLSPSKERPNTPRSAMKGTRNTFGVALKYNEPVTDRRVVWAKKSQCMNEEWEESMRSVESSQISTSEISHPSSLPTQQGLEASFEVQPQQPLTEQPRSGWFGWFRDAETECPQNFDQSIASSTSYSKASSSIACSRSPNSSTSVSDACDEISKDTLDPVTLPLRGIEEGITKICKPKAAATSADGTSKLPSYLRPPSYPSDPKRDASVPMSMSGSFTSVHFRTLHIIYKKSMKTRFHGPEYPAQIREPILDLVHKGWTLQVDESPTMGEDGIFEFKLGGTEARVLERFMQEVELGWEDRGMKVQWGWPIEDLAGNLARLAIGETIRAEEKAVEGILRSAKKIR